MEVLINIQDKEIVTSAKCLGTVGEDNATKLIFNFPKALAGEDINSLHLKIVFNNQNGSFVFDILHSDVYYFDIPKVVTTDTYIELQIIAEKDGQLIWKTEAYPFLLHQALKSDGKNLIDTLVDEKTESYRADLENSLETLTGKPQQPNDWQSLNNKVQTLDLKSDEDSNNLIDLSLIYNSIEKHNSVKHSLWSEHGTQELFDLPYLYTPNVPWVCGEGKRKSLSQYLRKCGFDVRGRKIFSKNGQTGGIAGWGYTDFNWLPNLEEIKLTGMQSEPSYGYLFFNDDRLRVADIETASKEMLLKSRYYYAQAFCNCYDLVTIKNPLDFTNQENINNTFINCNLLQNIEIVPNTIRTNFNIKWTSELSAASFLELLNGCANGKVENIGYEITINRKYAVFVDDVNDDFKVNIDEQRTAKYKEETGIDFNIYRTATNEEIANKNYKFLFDLFLDEKGVTINYE